MLYIARGISPHPPPMCSIHLDDVTAPERPPHTSLLVERRQSDEENQCNTHIYIYTVNTVIQ